MEAEMDKYQRALAMLAGGIISAEKRFESACLNGSTAQQVGASAELDHLRYAFALVTGGAVNGMYFNADLERAKVDFCRGVRLP